MLDLQLQTAHDLAVVLFHQVVDLGDGPGGGVLDGQDAVAAHAVLHRPEHAVKATEVEDLGQGEHLVAGDLGVGPLRPLTGHHSPGGEFAAALHRGQNILAQLRLAGIQTVFLVVPAQLQQGGVEDFGVLLELLAARARDPVEDVPLPVGRQDGGVVLLLVVRHVLDGFHALLEQRRQLIVDLVQLGPVVL